MYYAKFTWLQNEKFPIWEYVMKNSSSIIKEESGIKGQGNSPYTRCSLYLEILEDFSYDIKSDFQNYADAIGEVSGIAGSIMSFFQKLNTLSAMGGKESGAQEFMKYQIWKNTEPFRMSFKFCLETKTDPFDDVYAPAISLCSMGIISPVKEDGKWTFYVPGVNSGGMKALKQANQAKENESSQNEAQKGDGKSGQTVKSGGEKSNDKKAPGGEEQAPKNISKLLKYFSIVSMKVNDNSVGIDTKSLDFGGGESGGNPSDENSNAKLKSSVESARDEIPLVLVRDAFIESVKPTWSKDRTTSGIPLRCDIEVTIQSVFSANDAMFAYLKKPQNQSLFTTKQVTNIFR